MIIRINSTDDLEHIPAAQDGERLTVSYPAEYEGGEPNNGYTDETRDLVRALDECTAALGWGVFAHSGIEDDGSGEYLVYLAR